MGRRPGAGQLELERASPAWHYTVTGGSARRDCLNPSAWYNGSLDFLTQVNTVVPTRDDYRLEFFSPQSLDGAGLPVSRRAGHRSHVPS